MGMTMTQKILAAHAGLESGEARPAHRGPAATSCWATTSPRRWPSRISRRSAPARVFDQKKVVLVPDHFTPNKDIKAAEQCKMMREFAREQEIDQLFRGRARWASSTCSCRKRAWSAPGDVVIGADSHTCTYGALGAFSTGRRQHRHGRGHGHRARPGSGCPRPSGSSSTGKPGKFVAGKDVILHIIGMIGVDGALYQSLEFAGHGRRPPDHGRPLDHGQHGHRGRRQERHLPGGRQTAPLTSRRAAARPWKVFEPDADAEYDESLRDRPRPRSRRPSPSRTCRRTPGRPPSSATSRSTRWSSAPAPTAGWRTCGWRRRSSRGGKVARGVRLIVIPGTQEIYREALREGLIEIFIDAGARSARRPAGPAWAATWASWPRASAAVDHQPQLRRPHGPSRIRGLPGGPGGGGGHGGHGQDHRPGGARRLMNAKGGRR